MKWYLMLWVVDIINLNTPSISRDNMQRKTTAKQSYTKLTDRLTKAIDQVNKLTETTPTPMYGSSPDPNILKNLLEECEDSYFW